MINLCMCRLSYSEALIHYGEQTMDLRSKFSRLTAMQQSGDNEKVWQEFYTEDIVRRIGGHPLVGRDACRRQVQDFLDGLTAPQKWNW